MPRKEKNTDQYFKKTTQAFGGLRKPTDHNIADDYMRHPPHNLEHNIGHAGWQLPGLREGAKVEESVEQGVLGEPGIGRPKKEDQLANMAIEDSVHR
ncbi:hypothetical protein AX17_003055 [Amanita inopinata Kibby_2008]|nr:hypothetical protein AX17_003055 [Amanita inopinata Kibby_2008]